MVGPNEASFSRDCRWAWASLTDPRRSQVPALGDQSVCRTCRDIRKLVVRYGLDVSVRGRSSRVPELRILDKSKAGLHVRPLSRRAAGTLQARFSNTWTRSIALRRSDHRRYRIRWGNHCNAVARTLIEERLMNGIAITALGAVTSSHGRNHYMCAYAPVCRGQRSSDHGIVMTSRATGGPITGHPAGYVAGDSRTWAGGCVGTNRSRACAERDVALPRRRCRLWLRRDASPCCRFRRAVPPALTVLTRRSTSRSLRRSANASTVSSDRHARRASPRRPGSSESFAASRDLIARQRLSVSSSSS